MKGAFERSTERGAITPLAHFSRGKVLAFAAICWAMVVIPLIPGFKDGLVYTAFFFTPAGTPIRIAVFLIVVAGALIATVMAIHVAKDPVAVRFEGDELCWQALKVCCVPVAAVASAERSQWGIVTVRRNDGGRPFTLPEALYRSPRNSDAVLAALNRRD